MKALLCYLQKKFPLCKHSVGSRKKKLPLTGRKLQKNFLRKNSHLPSLAGKPNKQQFLLLF